MKGDHNISDLDEFERLELICSQATWQEMSRIFQGHESREFARAIGLEELSNNRTVNCQNIEAYYKYFEENAPSSPGQCTYSSVSKLNTSRPVLWLLDVDTSHANYADMINVIEYANRVWSDECSVEFKNTGKEQDADLVYKIGPLDDEDTFGVQLNERVITWNSRLAWNNKKKMGTTAHINGHAIGLEHNPNPDSLMHDFWNGQLKPTQSDIDTAKKLLKAA